MAGNRPSPAGLARRAVRWTRRRVLGPRPQPAILMYHRVAEESFDPWDLAVPPQVFARQLEWLAAHRTVLALTEFARLHRTGRLPAKAVAVTFDDAYACVAQIAAPMLNQARIAATIFIPAGLIGQGREFWWDELQRIVLETAADELLLDGERVTLGARRAEDWEWRPYAAPTTKRQQAFDALWSRLRTKAPAELVQAMAGLRMLGGVEKEPRSSHRTMTRGEIKATQSRTVEFGSHALTHPSLPSLPPSEKRGEILGSVERCAALTGRKPETLAYPYGDYDVESEALAAEAGFECAVTTDDTFVSSNSRLFALPRIQVGSWTPDHLTRVLAQ